MFIVQYKKDTADGREEAQQQNIPVGEQNLRILLSNTAAKNAGCPEKPVSLNSLLN